MKLSDYPDPQPLSLVKTIVLYLSPFFQSDLKPVVWLGEINILALVKMSSIEAERRFCIFSYIFQICQFSPEYLIKGILNRQKGRESGNLNKFSYIWG